MSLIPRLLSLAVLSLAAHSLTAQTPIPVAVVGLEHGHSNKIFSTLTEHPEFKLVAIVDADPALRNRYITSAHLDGVPVYNTLADLWKSGKPKPAAILVYTSVLGHRDAVIEAANHGVSAMVEKPLSTTLEDAVLMRAVARRNHTQLLVNLETTWYSSNDAVMKEINAGNLGDLRKIVVHDGNHGPADNKRVPEFVAALTDPVTNGAGALFDFGCYGADLATVILHGALPTSVTAVVQTDRPDLYPKVDDDATVILQYPTLQVVLMPSWTWEVDRKDTEVYGTKGYAIAIDPSVVRERHARKDNETTTTYPPLPRDAADSLGYLAAVLQGRTKPEGDLSALDTNMKVMQILDAARRSAAEHRTVQVKALP